MLRIKGTNSQFFAELLYFVWLLAVTFIAWQHNGILLAAMAFGIIIGLLFWHTREDVIFLAVGAFLGTLIQVIATDAGLLNYANPSIIGLPYWMPLFFAGIVLFAKRFKDSFFEMEHWKKHYGRTDFEYQLMAELLYIILLALILKYLTYSNIAATLFMLLLLLLQLLRWHTKEDWLYAIALLVIGMLIEIIGANTGIWQWQDTAFMRIPLWTGILYAYLGLVIRRVCVTMNYKVFGG